MNSSLKNLPLMPEIWFNLHTPYSTAKNGLARRGRGDEKQRPLSQCSRVPATTRYWSSWNHFPSSSCRTKFKRFYFVLFHFLLLFLLNHFFSFFPHWEVRTSVTNVGCAQIGKCTYIFVRWKSSDAISRFPNDSVSCVEHMYLNLLKEFIVRDWIWKAVAVCTSSGVDFVSHFQVDLT